MSPRNPDKNKDVIKELEKTISPILVVNNSSLKPYVELFEYAPENIYQQPLGSLVGFFEVKEFSEESAYIVNFLTSVLKKEYYINPKRPVTESLDSALHKVNMALSELAKHGNVEWLGKLNAAICVLEKNNAHFSVSGNAKMFLYRNQGLSEVSEDLASDFPEPHPLKTFINVSSGRLEKEDRLLITSADIFHILTVAEIKKNFQRFEGDRFVQFLKTALSNQIEMIASIIVEMTETTVAPISKTLSRKKSSLTANAFSEQTFANTLSSNTLAQEKEIDTTTELETEPEYTDEKTGHIYVQGETTENREAAHAQMNLYWDMVKEKITQGSYLTRNEIRKRFSLYKKQLAKKKELRRIEQEKQRQIQAEENKRLDGERAIQEIQREQQLAQDEEREKIRLVQKRIEQEKLVAKSISIEKKRQNNIPISGEGEEISSNPQSSFQEKLRLAKIEQQGSAVIDLSLKNKVPEKEVTVITEDKRIIEPEKETADIQKNSKISQYLIPCKQLFFRTIKKTKTSARQIAKKIPPLSKKVVTSAKAEIIKFLAKTRKSDDTKQKHLDITPHFSKIGKLFSHFSTKQKLYTLGALALVFIAPLFIVQFLNKPKNPTITELKIKPPSQMELLAKEKNINFSTQAKVAFPSQDIVTILIANDNPTLITKTDVIVLQDNQPKKFPLPTDSGNPILATYMNDLSLVLIFTDKNKMLSFSPISTKFIDNKINPANISSTSLIGTYLTYLYVLNQETNQVYRFPRADGGFGDQTSWLKDSTSLSEVSDMTIDDNIYAIQNNQILKFFKGQKQPFTPEASNTPVYFSKIYTTPNLQAIYTLDIQNSRIVQYSKDGSIIAQFYNEALKNGSSLTVDEANKIAYIATSQGLLSVSLQ